MRRFFLNLTFVLLATACQSRISTQPATIAIPEATFTPTKSPTAIPTATPVPFSELGISRIIDDTSGLPKGFTVNTREMSSNNSRLKEALPIWDYAVLKSISGPVPLGNIGTVSVVLYTSQSDSQKAYQNLDLRADGGKEENVPNLGNIASKKQGARLSDVKFVRCHAFVDILSFSLSVEDIVNYAKNLDTRLKDIVCNRN